MSAINIEKNIRYDLIPNYTMKCRLYPNKGMAKKIDDILYSAKVAYNMALHDTFVNKANTREWVDPKSGETVHFPRTDEMAKSDYLNELRSRNPRITNIPAGALSGKNGLFRCDMQKMLESQSNSDNNSDGEKKKKNKSNGSGNSKKKKATRPIESSEPHYYSKAHPRKSYTYQQACSSILFGENKNVFYINLAKVGKVKVRGWNQEIRFNDEYKDDFSDYVSKNPKQRITVTVSKDNCGDYWICFKLLNVYKPMSIVNFDNRVGIDVGIKDIATLSNGFKYENMRFNKKEKCHLKALNRCLSRRYGYGNEKFREDRKNDKGIQPSKRYQMAKLSYAKLNRKIANRRSNYYHNISREIVENNYFIGIESLNVSGMLSNRHCAYALSDAALYSLLQMLKYKADWHNRIVQPIDMWYPSSKRCSCCGCIKPRMTLSVREWVCPNCGTHHDRDINAAINILYAALEIYNSNHIDKKMIISILPTMDRAVNIGNELCI